MLAGLEITAKSVERAAESIGADIATSEQQQIERAVQLHLPIVLRKPVPILYIEIDGSGVPVFKKEPKAAKANSMVYLRTPERSNSAACSRKPAGMSKGSSFATKNRPAILGPLKTPGGTARIVGSGSRF
jgi:hypothetical protein